MVVVDNTALSTLARISELNVLEFLYDEIIIPADVNLEFSKKWDIELNQLWKVLTVNEKSADSQGYSGLSKADYACFTIAKKNGTGLITDNLKLRMYCENEGVAVIGTMGILRVAYNKKYFEDYDEYRQLIHSIAKDLYLSEKLIEWALKR